MRNWNSAIYFGPQTLKMNEYSLVNSITTDIETDIETERVKQWKQLKCHETCLISKNKFNVIGIKVLYPFSFLKFSD